MPVLALVASAEVQTVVVLAVVALAAVLVAQIAAALAVVAVLAGSSAVASGQPVVALAHPLPRTLSRYPEYYL